MTYAIIGSGAIGGALAREITEHWGVANLYSVLQQLGAIAPLPTN